MAEEPGRRQPGSCCIAQTPQLAAELQLPVAQIPVARLPDRNINCIKVAVSRDFFGKNVFAERFLGEKISKTLMTLPL